MSIAASTPAVAAIRAELSEADGLNIDVPWPEASIDAPAKPAICAVLKNITLRTELMLLLNVRSLGMWTTVAHW